MRFILVLLFVASRAFGSGGALLSTAGGGSGNVVGPGSSVAGDIATFADATGELLADSGVQAPVASTVNTTTAAVTTLMTITPASNTSTLIRVSVVGKRTGGSAGTAGDSAVLIRTARCKNIAGTVTVDNLFDDYTARDQASWDMDIAASGSTCLIRVNAATNNNVTWDGVTTLVVN